MAQITDLVDLHTQEDYPRKEELAKVPRDATDRPRRLQRARGMQGTRRVSEDSSS